MNLTGKSVDELQGALKHLGQATIPGLFAERVKEEPGAVAVRYKRGGMFRQLTWSDYRDEIRTIAAGLVEAGLRPGSRIAIMGDICIEYLPPDLPATLIGENTYRLYPT